LFFGLSVDCTGGQFQCHGGQCIPLCKHCDGILDCYDQSDELNCGKFFYKCNLGTNILKDYSDCKKYFCAQYSLETSAPSLQLAPVISTILKSIGCAKELSFQFFRLFTSFRLMIVVYTMMMMIMMMMMMCAACHENQFRCSNGHCISACRRCDARRDCADGSDETNCCKIF